MNTLDNQELYMPDTQIMMVMLDRGELIITEGAFGIQGTPSQEMCLFHTPAAVVHDRQHGVLGFLLAPWIPNELLASPTIRVARSRFVGFLNPTQELINFYKSWALTEQDKLKQFGKEFNEALTEIEKTYTDRYKDAVKRKTVYSTSSETHNHELLVSLFEEDTNWGNTAVTH